MLKRAVHPGTVLKHELAELGISPTEFARQNAPPKAVPVPGARGGALDARRSSRRTRRH
jgi:hypothetical protein